MDATDFSLCARTSLPIKVLRVDWERIGRLADYFGSVTSARRADPARHANLYATVLNELLELAVRTARSDGRLNLALLVNGATDRIEMAVDCEPSTGFRICERIVGLDQATAGAALHAALVAQNPPDPCIGVWEIVADFGGEVDATLEPEGLRLLVNLRLEDGS